MRRTALCLLAAWIAASAWTHGGERPPKPAPGPAALIERLGSDSAKARDEALEALVALGEKAVGPLQKAAKHPDPEVRWRVAAALHRIRWRIGRKLAARIGDLMHQFETRSVGEREMICRDLSLVGIEEAVPTLSRILTTDPSRAVRHAAARGLVILGDEGLKALAAAGVKSEGLSLYTVSVRVHLGNSHLERSEYKKALEQYRLGLKIEPKNSICHYNVACTYSRMKDIEKALDALEKSVECGYRDVDWMEKDADLDNLRDQPRYKAIVRKLRELE